MEADPLVQTRINIFRSDLSQLPVPIIVRKHITFGDCYILNHDKHFYLKSHVADHFEIHPNEVLIIGSAKLGFSIAQNKRYRHFSDRSDIDVAIVSARLFDEIWQQVFDYWNDVRYWPYEEVFKSNLFRGWIRPDKLPRSEQFPLQKDWWDFFQEVTRSGVHGSYKVSARLYKSWHYLETYQSICVKQCKQELGV